MNTASRRNNTRSGSVSSACDQSTEARKVCWRRTAVRAPPVNSRNRSCKLSRISVSDNARTRAAANSIASGKPSRRRADFAHRSADVVVADRRNRARARRARSVNSSTASSVERQRRHPPAHLAGHPDRFTARRQARQPRTCVEQRDHQRRARIQQCSQLSSTTSICRSAINRVNVSIVERPGWSGSPSARAIVIGTRLGVGDRRQIHIPDPAAELVGELARDLVLPAGSYLRRPHRSTSPTRFSASSSRT